MALHLNLYHELHTAAQQRARDPAKLALLGVMGVLLLLVGYYFYRMNAVSSLRTEQLAIQAEWRKLEPLEKEAKLKAEEARPNQIANAAIVARVEGRFYWAALLDQFAGAVPQGIQIRSLLGTLDKPRESNAHSSVTLLIAGLAAGEEPRTTAEEFRLGLAGHFGKLYPAASAHFDANSLEETGQTIEIDGKKLRTATFRIRLEITPPQPAATPPPLPEPAAKSAKSPAKR